ncbi:MAG TPA: ATP-grasp domain-containing protein [Deltaproteobacteria bacterium]|jgi:carbamoyl-phosphate synthase large subunit|nr:ATP-grasp domain-containing protein [Deltaproteobacteria bacterium]
MKRYNVLVTGVGAIIGYGIVRSLRQCRYDVHIIGMDVYPDAVGQRWCDAFLRSIWASDAGYCDFLAEVIDKYKIDLVFFGVEQEIHRLYDDWDAFRGDFKRLILNDRALIGISKDKWQLYEYLTANKFKAIKTLTTGEYEAVADILGVPCLVKPRCSTASKGITIIRSREDFYYWKNKLGKDFMVQEIVGDDEHEYTVGVFGLGDGSMSQSIAFSRKLSREGSTAKAQTVNISELDEEVTRLTALFKPIGPTNFQVRRHQGDYLLLEVNPRFSSSLSLRTAFGFNEPEMCIEYFGEQIKPRPAVITQGKAVRYIEDIVIQA